MSFNGMAVRKLTVKFYVRTYYHPISHIKIKVFFLRLISSLS